LLLIPGGSPGNRRLGAGRLEAGYFVTTANAKEEALHLLVELQPDLLLLGTDVIRTHGWKLSRLSGPQLPELAAADEPDLEQVMARVEVLVRTSLLPPPLDSISA